MSGSSRWNLKPDCFYRALAEWRATNPDPETSSHVHDRLIDLADDPLRMGREDPDHPGVRQVRVQGADVIIVFVLDFENRSVCVASIFEAS